MSVTNIPKQEKRYGDTCSYCNSGTLNKLLTDNILTCNECDACFELLSPNMTTLSLLLNTFTNLHRKMAESKNHNHMTYDAVATIQKHIAAILRNLEADEDALKVLLSTLEDLTSIKPFEPGNTSERLAEGTSFVTKNVSGICKKLVGSK